MYKTRRNLPTAPLADNLVSIQPESHQARPNPIKRSSSTKLLVIIGSKLRLCKSASFAV
ncbi:uncharacterized protein TrAtP1_012766 [Trichoderma atroviride]|uniref:uncharacterized protein n=1 Tax=Hypocrea atroviridis TaxID=63577 RepID=UPI003317350F|nr:hypothetical protein TrAtP1_012766 [Trichoderma atroviride]